MKDSVHALLLVYKSSTKENGFGIHGKFQQIQNTEYNYQKLRTPIFDSLSSTAPKQQTIQQTILSDKVCMPCGRSTGIMFVFFLLSIGYDFFCSNDERFALIDSIRSSNASVSFTLALRSTFSSSLASGMVSN